MRLYSILVLLIVFLFSGCSWVKFPSIHKVSVQQGNIVNQEMIDKLQPGMSKPQVQYIMGTPLIVDTFSPLHWDYFYSKVDSKGSKSEQRVSLTFDNTNLLLSIDGAFSLPINTADKNQ